MAILAILAAAPASAGTISSAYTDFDARRLCTPVKSGGGGDEGDWGESVCAGWRGYPVLTRFAFGRLFFYYGFPPYEEDLPLRDSFGLPHTIGAKIEWRIDTEGEVARPYAAIHRWIIAAFDGTPEIQVLAVNKVGQSDGETGCIIGYVMASGNPQANEQARAMADQKAREFVCGITPPQILPAGANLPLYRQD